MKKELKILVGNEAKQIYKDINLDKSINGFFNSDEGLTAFTTNNGFMSSSIFMTKEEAINWINHQNNNDDFDDIPFK